MQALVVVDGPVAFDDAVGVEAGPLELAVDVRREDRDVSRRDDDLRPLQAQPIGDLSDGCCLADAVDAYHQDYVQGIRKMEGRSRIITVDFDEILDGERDDVVLEADDVVYVPESIF